MFADIADDLKACFNDLFALIVAAFPTASAVTMLYRIFHLEFFFCLFVCLLDILLLLVILLWQAARVN